jgi:hypothetical protein
VNTVRLHPDFRRLWSRQLEVIQAFMPEWFDIAVEIVRALRSAVLLCTAVKGLFKTKRPDSK